MAHIWQYSIIKDMTMFFAERKWLNPKLKACTFRSYRIQKIAAVGA